MKKPPQISDQPDQDRDHGPASSRRPYRKPQLRPCGQLRPSLQLGSPPPPP
ncbi:MAG: hypothetical protein GY856_38815 [bacterium]|nr:hypothetical protein [bacterium]